ncbi:uncharacterized protein [Arachis hypogaea]|uniref:BRO1 domain-containing protein n=1 Tax=Arachis hypogaea TaxID=3818 RepID=A0A445EHV3_ARAHY|nr:uncharacterized protein LOC112733968 [Arachis hypogaea]QHO52126.1 uncharacterized protein DS421_2g36890 [Arachis hypogaea]RYR75020.1 hypothetical protein Ahy_A02g009725 [Arachis hypogaea]
MSNDNPRLLNPNPNPERVLAIPVKKSNPVELYRPLRKLVETKYSESDAQKVESVLETLNKCRSDMVERGDLSLPELRDCLIHYFKCLCMVEPLFTAISSDSELINFVWYDAFYSEHNNGVSSQHNSIQLELAAVVFNLGAVCSQIGASYDRTTALGLHLAMDAFNAAARFFLKLWKDLTKDVSATLDLTLLFAESLHCLFSAQALELKSQQQLKDNSSSAFQKYRCAVSFKSASEHYQRAYDLIVGDSVATEHIHKFDQTWITHLRQKKEFFQVEARQRLSSVQPKSRPRKSFSSICALDHDAESVTEKLVRGICWRVDQWMPKLEGVYLDLVLSQDSPFKIMDGGKLVANPWDMPPPYPTNFSIPSSSSSSHILALPLKKSEPLDLYESLRNCFVLKYSESVAKRVEGLLEMLNKLRSEMLRDDLSLPLRRDCLIRYYKCLCMIEPLFPMTSSSNPPIFVWYNAFNPQEKSSQHNIHLEKASVLFNLGALGSHIALSCDLTTIQGQRIAIDALHDASYWFLILTHEAEKASATIDLSISCTQMLREIITAQVADLECNFPHPRYVSVSAGCPVSVLYRKAFEMSTFGPLAETRVQSLIPQHLVSIIRTCLIEFAPSDVTEQFLTGYWKAAQFLTGYCKGQAVLPVGCQPPCLDLLSKAGPVMIKDGHLVANLSGSDIRIGGDQLPGDHSNMAIDQN